MALDLSKSVFFISETKPELLPQSISEVAFVGRSNVGKSSVINAVCKTKNLARTSKTPGRTRAINIFTPAKGRWIVDLPGYGFARVTEEEKEDMEEVLRNLEELEEVAQNLKLWVAKNQKQKGGVSP